MDVSGINAAQIGVALTFTSGFADTVHSSISVTPWVVILAPMFALMTKAAADFEVRLPSSSSKHDLTVLEDRYELHRKG